MLAIVFVVGIVIIVLASNGTLQPTIETAHKSVEIICNARETALTELEKKMIRDQIWSMSPENKKFLEQIHDAGSIRYCDLDKLQWLMDTTKLKSLDRLRSAPCEVFVCMSGNP